MKEKLPCCLCIKNQHPRNKHRKHIDFLFHKILSEELRSASLTGSQIYFTKYRFLLEVGAPESGQHCVKIRKLGTAKLREKWAIGPEDVTHWAGSGFFLLDDNAPGKKIKHMDMCTPVFPFQSTTRSSSMGSQTTEWVCFSIWWLYCCIRQICHDPSTLHIQHALYHRILEKTRGNPVFFPI